MYDKNRNLVGEVDKIKMFGFDVYLDCNKEMAERYKKHLSIYLNKLV